LSKTKIPLSFSFSEDMDGLTDFLYERRLLKGGKPSIKIFKKSDIIIFGLQHYSSTFDSSIFVHSHLISLA